MHAEKHELRCQGPNLVRYTEGERNHDEVGTVRSTKIPKSISGTENRMIAKTGI